MRTIASATGLLAAVIAVSLALGHRVSARSATPVRSLAAAHTSRPARTPRLTGTIPRALRVALRRLVARGFVTPMVHPRGLLRGRHLVPRNAFAPLVPHGRACYAGPLNCSARPCVEFAGDANSVVLRLTPSVMVVGPGSPHASARDVAPASGHACRRAPARVQRVVLGG